MPQPSSSAFLPDLCDATRISDLQQDCFGAVLACLDCRSLAQAQCVSRGWAMAARSDALWRAHARLEFGVTALPPERASFRALFTACLAAPTLAPLRCEARFVSLLASVASWTVRVERFARPQPRQRLKGGADAPGPTSSSGTGPASGPSRAGPQQRSQHRQQPTGTDSGGCILDMDEGYPPSCAGDAPVAAEVTACQHLIQNRQSVWVKFALPQWVRGGEEGYAGGAGDGPGAWAVESPRGPWNLLVVEAHLACGRVVEVIRSEGFRMPRSDLEMLVQSHTEGLYAWEADAPDSDAPGPSGAPQPSMAPGLPATPGSHSRMPHGPRRASRALSVVAYIHYEQLLPLAAQHGLPSPQALPLPPLPLWTSPAPPSASAPSDASGSTAVGHPPKPPLHPAPTHRADAGQQSSSPGQGPSSTARPELPAKATASGAVTLSTPRAPAAYLHIDWCTLQRSGRRGSAWVALYLQWHESRFVMMGVELTEHDIVMMPGDTEMASLPGSPSVADALVAGRPPGTAAAAGAALHSQRQAVPPTTGPSSRQEAPPHAASTSHAFASCSSAATPLPPPLGQALSQLSLAQPSDASAPGPSNGVTASSASCSSPFSSHPPHAQLSPPPLRCPSDVAATCDALSELCAADGMVDFSLWSPSGRLLLGRAGVELWSKSTDSATNYCCHFLVDGIADASFRQSLWENTLWVRPDAGLVGAAFALSLTVEAARAVFGEEAAEGWS